MRVHGIERIRLAMDPFLGLGSSAAAAAKLGVSFVGFEIDPEYASQSCRRVEALLGK
jgi:site-specific DNA-methyltransferase (adenine-specific)